MKKYLLYIVCFISFTSCGDFLDEYSQDLVVVKTVEDLDEVLLGDVYLPNKGISGCLQNGCMVIRIGCKRLERLLMGVLPLLVMIVLGWRLIIV